MVGKRVRAPRPQGSRKFRKTRKRDVSMVRSISSKNMQKRIQGSSTAVSLHYNELNPLNSGVAGTTASYVFRLSSIFDPSFTGVGHQPLGRDQLEPLYERYQVYKVDFHIEFANRATANNQRVGYRISDVPDTDVDPDVNIENGNCEWSMINTKDGNGRVAFFGSVWLNEVHGVSYKQYMANDDYGANFNANPSEEAYLIVFVDGLGFDPDPVDCNTHLVYHTKLMGSKLTGLS